MNIYDEQHRKVNPGSESVGSDLFTVLRYDPIQQTCDLSSASIHQRGQLKEVPIAQAFGGAWENQKFHEPKLAGGVNETNWGNCARGPRWGVAYPIQPGDLCRVMYQGESQADPVITQFYRSPGNYGVPWVANQVLSGENDYTKNTPLDDDEPEGRYDVLLPSGAWLRALQSGSWVVATRPVDRPMAYVVLDANGCIKIKSRDAKEYKFHLEFDPNKEEGRICVGELEGGSYIEFKDGDITIRAKRNIKIQGQRVDGDVKPQKTQAIDAIAAMPASTLRETPSGQIKDLTAQAAGEMVLGGAMAPVSKKPGVVVVQPMKKDLISNLIANPAIDGAVRGQIGDILQDPQGLVNHVLGGFSGGLEQLGTGNQLVKLLGANALAGNLGDITSKLDLGSLPMVKELGIPSWVGQAIQGQGIQLPTLLQQVPALIGMGDNQLLSEVVKQAGAFAVGGADALQATSLLNSAIAGLPNDLKTRINGLLEDIDIIPMATPRQGDGQTDWTNTVAQRLGAYIMRGNTQLGGAAKLFDLEQIRGLVDPDTFKQVEDTAGQIESYYSNPHELYEPPKDVEPFMEVLDKLPPEVRGAIASLTPDQLGEFPQLLQTILGSGLVNLDVRKLETALSSFDLSQLTNVLRGVDVDGGHMGLTGLEPDLGDFAGAIASAPDSAKELLKGLPQKVFDSMKGMLPDQLSGLLSNPGSFVKGINPDLIRSVFGEGYSQGAGVFDMKVSKIAKFNTIPRTAKPLDGLNTVDEFHLQTFGFPVERVVEYGELNLPDYWANG